MKVEGSSTLALPYSNETTMNLSLSVLLMISCCAFVKYLARRDGVWRYGVFRNQLCKLTIATTSAVEKLYDMVMKNIRLKFLKWGASNRQTCTVSTPCGVTNGKITCHACCECMESNKGH